MAIPRFYCRHPVTQLVIGESVVLSKETSHHITSVLRMRLGEQVGLFDGGEYEVQAEIVEIGRREVVVALQQASKPQRESALNCHVFQALLRPQKMDVVLQKSVELGVKAMTPVLTERCQGKAMAATFEAKRRHFQQVIVSACEQCGRTQVPVLHPVQSFAEAVAATRGWVLDPTSEQGVASLPDAAPEQVAVMVGPEGGFSPAEIEQATDWQRLALGPRVLRTETAAPAILAVLQARWGDWS